MIRPPIVIYEPPLIPKGRPPIAFVAPNPPRKSARSRKEKFERIFSKMGWDNDRHHRFS
jgi:hypothetical protein